MPASPVPAAILAAAGCVLLAGRAWTGRVWLWSLTALIALASAMAVLSQSAAEPLTATLSWGCLGTATLLALAAMESDPEARRPAPALGMLLLGTAGGLIVAAADQLPLMYAGLELALLPVSLWLSRPACGGPTSVRPLVLGLLSSLLVLYGLAFVYGLTGTVSVSGLQEVLAASYRTGDTHLDVARASRLGVVGLVLLTAGLGIRLAAVPFHFGLVETARDASPWSGSLLAVWPKVVVTIVLLRLIPGTLVGYEAASQLLFGLLAGVTMVGGAALAFAQSNLRRMLALVSVAQGGFVLLGLAAACTDVMPPGGGPARGLPHGIPAALFALAAAVVPVVGLLAVVGSLGRGGQRRVDYAEDLTGLLGSAPAAAICVVVCLSSLAGLPLTPGFWSRLWAVTSALNAPPLASGPLDPEPHAGFLALAAAATLGWFLLACICLKLIALVVLHAPLSRQDSSARASVPAAAVIAAFACIGIGLLPGPLLARLSSAHLAATGAAMTSRPEPGR